METLSAGFARQSVRQHTWQDVDLLHYRLQPWWVLDGRALRTMLAGALFDRV
jgi:hypothetical protein